MQTSFSLILFPIFVFFPLSQAIKPVDEINCHGNSFRSFFQNFLYLLNSNPGSYTLLFHSFNHKCSIFQSSIPSMTFGKHFNKDIGIEFYRKHFQSYHFIIATLPLKQVDYTTSNIAKTFYQFSLHPRNIFMYRIKTDISNIERAPWFSYADAVVPSAKLFLRFFKGFDFVAHYICAGYCTNNNRHWERVPLYNLISELRDPNLLHRRLFRNANWYQIQYSGIRFRDLIDGSTPCKSNHIQHHCCDTAHMVARILKAVHNFSIRIEVGAPFTHKHGQYIDTSTNLASFGNTIGTEAHLKTGTAFRKQITEGILYCQERKQILQNSLAINIWIESLSVGACCLVFIFFVAIVYLESWLGHQTILNAYRIINDLFLFLGISVVLRSKHHKVYIFTSIFGMLVVPFYTNEITSLITVSYHAKPFHSIIQVLDAGYKIVYPIWYKYSPTEWERFFGEFKRRKISYSVKDVFVYNESHRGYTDFEWSQLLSTKNAQVVVLESVTDIPMATNLIKVYQKKDYVCFTLEEKLSTGRRYLIAYLINRHWVLQTFSRIYESALLEKWNEWKDLSYLYNNGIRDPSQSSDKIVTKGVYVSLANILPVICFLCALLLCEIIIFLIELLNKSGVSKTCGCNINISRSTKVHLILSTI